MTDVLITIHPARFQSRHGRNFSILQIGFYNDKKDF